ncbi:MAG: 3-mercaptopyruvate sulfurtransferase [Pseudomonadota bacterium]
MKVSDDDAHIPPLVSAAWLLENFHRQDLAIVDASWRMPGAGFAHADHLARHIPGAVFFDIDAAAAPDTDLPHMAPSPDAFAAYVSNLGLSNDHTVVVYDDIGVFSAPRVWWTFRLMGHAPVVVLNGGLPAWRDAGGVLEDGPSKIRQSALFHASFSPHHLADAEMVQRALTNKNAVVLDARPAPRFSGRTAEPRSGLRCGHMPGARNLPYTELIDKRGQMKSAKSLAETFDTVGVSPDQEIISSCGSGVTAAILALGLHLIGCEHVRVYDGSWAEWGRLSNDTGAFPVATND